MNASFIPFLKRNATVLILSVGLVVYVLVAGISGSCPACTAITDLVGLSSSNDTGSVSASGSAMPSWELTDLQGQPVSSGDFEGKVVLLDFWATWCPPCRKEIPGFIELQERYGKAGLVVVGVSLDEGGPAAVAPFVSKMGINYPVVMGDSAIVQAFGGVEAIPTTFVIDRDGQILERHVGFVSKDRFEKSIQPLL
jgi:thiol-disulfide isomerase/thioredoxin